jgi:hypothetical protein
MHSVTEEFIGKGEVKGTVFRQVYRYKDICIYFRSDDHFEVVKIRVQESCLRVINGASVEFTGKEVYPKGEKWGPHEKCCKDLESAVLAFNLLACSQRYEFRLDMGNPSIRAFKRS